MSLNLNWDEQPLGETFDSVIAEKLNVTIDVVRKQRTKRQITAYRKKQHKYTNWNEQPLGIMSDRIIGERLGVPQGTVKSARRRKKIEAKYATGSTCRMHFSIAEANLLETYLNATLRKQDISALSRRKEFTQILFEIQRVRNRIQQKSKK